MHFRNLGKSGLKVSVIGLGTNQFGGKVNQESVTEIMSTALDIGINFIDTADVYQEGRSEELIGQALRGRRERAVIATKFFHPTGESPNQRGASRLYILKAVEASLRRLQTDYIDLYQIHRWDNETPIEETMAALDSLIQAGKVRYIGASNFTAWQLVHANSSALINGWSQFISLQPHYHMFERTVESEIIPACNYFNIGVLPYFPLAGGFLTGKYRKGEAAPVGSRGESSQYVQRYMTESNYSKINDLMSLAGESGHSITELAHSWLLSQPQVASVISGATKVEQVKANSNSADWVLDQETVSKVNQILAA